MLANGATVFIVDDDASFLTSAARLFRRSGFAVKTYLSAADFLAERSGQELGCVVADLSMPGMNGMALQDHIAQSEAPLPVVFLTGHGDVPTSVTAMRRGAEDFLTKRAPKADLLAAVHRALERNARETEQRNRRRELRERFGKLTPRDHEVLVHVLSGQLNKQIASDLGINERSVKRHRTSLMTKLEVSSVAELSHLAHEAGMTTPGRFAQASSKPQLRTA
jgi:FixJ family two-component response regulator